MTRKRKKITPKIRLEVLERDAYTCKICGRSPANNPELYLEVDHIVPVAKNGSDELSNYQVLCHECNRGKGTNERFNRTVKNDLDAILNYIHPQILKDLEAHGIARVVANQEDFTKIYEKTSHGNPYHIEVIPNTIMGLGAGRSFGIYTVHDTGGAKINFFIKKSNPSPSPCEEVDR